MMYRTMLAPGPWWIESATLIEVPWPQVARICGQPYGFAPGVGPNPTLALEQDHLVYAALFAATGYPWLNPAGPWPAGAWFDENGWIVKKPRVRR